MLLGIENNYLRDRLFDQAADSNDQELSVVGLNLKVPLRPGTAKHRVEFFDQTLGSPGQHGYFASR